MCKILIHKPYIKISSKKTRLCTLINIGNKKKELYYEVDNIYRDALCEEKGDAFVCALIVRAMELGFNIISEAPISDDLYYQLENYYIPIMSDNMKELKRIHIISKLTSTIYHGTGVATGASGGVDSFYSIVKHLNEKVKSRKLTHALFTNIATLDNKEGRIREWYTQRKKLIENTTETLKINFISVYTNIYEFYSFPYTSYSYYFTPMYASNAYALQKLVGVYYHSSGVTLNDFTLKNAGDNAYFDIFNLKCLSTKAVTFYSSGIEVSRIQKIKYIVNHDINNVVKNNLSVCAQEVTGRGFVFEKKLNCGVCNKCMRTVAELYATGVINDYKDIFDTTLFEKNREKYLAKMTCLNGKAFNNEIINLLKFNNQLTVSYYIWLALMQPIYKIKNINFLRRNSIIRRFYYKFKIDKLLNGYRPDTDDGINWKNVK